MKREVFVLFILILGIGIVSSHQPRLVNNQLNIIIENPEISQAFYGEMQGKEVYYTINSNSNFAFYTGILVPDLKDIEKDIFVEISKDGEVIYFLDGSNFTWEYFYEEFGGDSYYKGPEIRMNAEKGNYTIKVFIPDNNGKYVLAVGEKESFPIDETIKTIILLPKLKSSFFEKSALTAYFNFVGLFMAILLLVFIGVIFLIVFLIKKKKKRH